jgi:hypothetical protein
LIVRTTLVVGTAIAAREAAIARRLRADVPTAVILDGIPDGGNALDAAAAHQKLLIARIAPGCLCCTGNLTMRVTLNRMLRQRPHELYIGVASSTHLASLREFLCDAPYDTMLQLAPLIDCDAPR